MPPTQTPAPGYDTRGKSGTVWKVENDSLVWLKKKYLGVNRNKEQVKGFIQKISVYPVVPSPWTKGTFAASFLQPFIRRPENAKET